MRISRRSLRNLNKGGLLVRAWLERWRWHTRQSRKNQVRLLRGLHRLIQHAHLMSNRLAQASHIWRLSSLRTNNWNPWWGLRPTCKVLGLLLLHNVLSFHMQLLSYLSLLVQFDYPDHSDDPDNSEHASEFAGSCCFCNVSSLRTVWLAFSYNEFPEPANVRNHRNYTQQVE